MISRSYTCSRFLVFNVILSKAHTSALVRISGFSNSVRYQLIHSLGNSDQSIIVDEILNTQTHQITRQHTYNNHSLFIHVMSLLITYCPISPCWASTTRHKSLCMQTQRTVLYSDWPVCLLPFSHILENMSILQNVMQ